MKSKSARCTSLLLALAAAGSLTHAAEPPLSSYTVTRTTGTLTIDGNLDEADWKRAREFTLVETNTGKPVPLKSTVKFLWDDQFLYAAFFCEDPDAWATLTKEDDPLWGEEVVE
ncbi:MAG: carbohydrate-binding family 9-like protein, partial [Candidatus Latescibacterota bacterium]